MAAMHGFPPLRFRAPSNGVTQGGGRWAVYERVDLEDEQLVEFAEGVRTGQWPSGKPASVVAFRCIVCGFD
jgi:hypothetical protein